VDLTIPPEFETTAYVLEQLKIIQEARSFKDAIVKLELKLTGVDSPNVDRSAIEQYLAEVGVHYICNFSESRKVAVVPIAKQQLVDSAIHPKTAIKLYADQLKFDSEEMKSRYMELAASIVDEYQASVSK
jgi:hypothetical protein